MTSTLDAAPPRAAWPLYPPERYFDRPDWLEAGQKLTVVPDGEDAGRVAGYVAGWDTCIIDGRPGCWNPPPSPTAYRGAMQGETITAEGTTIPTANIGGGVNHARLSAAFAGAVKHYENTAAQTMRVQYGEDEYGIWFAGVAWPELADERELAMLRAAAVSGDWRFRPEIGAVDLCGVQLVNQPGLPLVRGFARAAGLGEWVDDPAGELASVWIGGLGGVGDIDPEPDAGTCPTCGHDQALVADLVAVTAALVATVGAEDVRARL